MTIPIYPKIVTDQDLSPDVGFGQEIDDLCEDIYKATKGWGADKQKVIDSLAGQDVDTRHKISLRYPELYEGKSLHELMKKEFSGDLKDGLSFLALPMHEAECAMIKLACKGVGAQVNVVWSTLCGRTNQEMDLLKKTFFRMYDKDLGKLLASELHGDMERLIFNCLQAAEEVYDPQFHTADKVVEDCEEVHAKGQGKMLGTDGRGIFKILCRAPPEHLQNMNTVYAEKYGYTLMKAMSKELSGKVSDAAVFMLGMKQKPYETIAELIKTSCAGIGTDELLLTCCCIRYQSVMGEVMSAHIEEFGKTVHDRVRSEAGGKYKELLLQVLNTAWPEEG